MPIAHKENSTAEESEMSSFPVVGIGASAGGLDAFTQLLTRLPVNSGMAFVLVQHLDPMHQSQLTELLSKTTRLPVIEVTDRLPLRPDHVYVIPPNVNMAIDDALLRLSPRGDARNQHLPIDFFLRSLAEARQSQAIGVVLSGTGSDGSLGLAEIKAVGGITFAQDESAQYTAMPLNAVNSSCVDFVLPIEGIAAELTRMGRHPYLRPAPSVAADPDADKAFQQILARLRKSTGVDFGSYRDTTIKRRIARRMALQRYESLRDYISFLEAEPREVEGLYQDILITVTSFFRDPEVFEALKTTVFPQVIRNKSPEQPVRIWVPGCSTGQEVYSIAMALLEFLDGEPMRPPVQVFGTDINDKLTIEKARPGLYFYGVEAEVSPERLRRFFTKEEGGYRIGKQIREMCVFARQNVAADPPFSRMDLISCRNLLIYLSASLQKKVIPTFHYALNPDGFLLLGASETVGRFTELFEEVDKKHNIYSKTEVLARTYAFGTAEYRPAALPREHTLPERRPTLADMQKEADRILLGQYSPPAVLVDEELEILQFRGRTHPYLEPASGQASLNLLKMAHANLFVPLRNAIEEAKRQNAVVRRGQLRLQDDQGVHKVDLEVRPIRIHDAPQRCFLILFIEAPLSTVSVTDLKQPSMTEVDVGEVVELKQELAETKDYLQAIIEQQSAANEELQSANEEIRSSNEELQSTNEEMQTAKEELQSTNEELRTVNDELQGRNREVSLLSNDLTNILSSIKLPIVVLSSDLRIRRFTPNAVTLLNLIPTDLGRPFRDLRPVFDISNLETMMLEVIASVTTKEQEVQDRSGRWYLLGLHPYRTADNRIDGVVLVLQDIDERYRIQEQVRNAKDIAEVAGRSKDHFLAVLSHELRTPLTPVLATISMLQEDAGIDADMRESLEIIRRNTELEARLIDDLLDVTRITRGKVELKREPVVLYTILTSAAEVCMPDIEAKRLDFNIAPMPDGPDLVLGDPVRLQQVFWNLLRNAVKFTPDGGSIGVRCQGENGNVAVEVTDSGVGIEAAVLEHVFSVFEQGSMETTRQFGGLGLGLTICKALVEAHGGTISAHSEGKNRGATFRVVLPAHVTPRHERKAAPATAPAQAPAQRLRILLVEDHADTARVMCRLLASDGHEVKAAGDVAMALQLAQERSFDLLISDLGLPDGNGYDLVKELRDRGRSLPAIALSGYGQGEDVEHSRAAGFSAHLIKPINMQQLQDAIRAVEATRVGVGSP